MKYLLASLGLALLLCTGSSLPAAAESGEFYHRDVWTERSAEKPRVKRSRAARYVYIDEEARPRRRTYRHDGGYRSRYVKRRAARVAKHLRRHKRVARRPGISRKAAHLRKKPAARAAAAPAAKAPALKPPTAKKPATRAASAPPVKKGVTVEKRQGQHGVASYYWQPQPVASGGRFNPNGLTAAHKTLPFGTRVRVTHLGNGKSVEVKINDRGPYIAGRIIDLSRAAAGVIGMTGQGLARVVVEILGR
jgi:rare lipoprotein A